MTDEQERYAASELRGVSFRKPGDLVSGSAESAPVVADEKPISEQLRAIEARVYELADVMHHNGPGRLWEQQSAISRDLRAVLPAIERLEVERERYWRALSGRCAECGRVEKRWDAGDYEWSVHRRDSGTFTHDWTAFAPSTPEPREPASLCQKERDRWKARAEAAEAALREIANDRVGNTYLLRDKARRALSRTQEAASEEK